MKKICENQSPIVQVSLAEETLNRVMYQCKKLGLAKSAFCRMAVIEKLARLEAQDEKISR